MAGTSLCVSKNLKEQMLLLLLLLIIKEPTDIPSRKKLMRWVCARRGSLL